MKIRAQVEDRVHEVEVERENGAYAVVIDGVRRLVDAQALEGEVYSLLLDGKSYEVSVAQDADDYLVRHGGFVATVRFADPTRTARAALEGGDGPQKVSSSMPGKVVRVLVAVGDAVERGQGLAVVEAMKMENEVPSPRAGKVVEVCVSPGQAVETGALLVVVG